MKTKWLFGLLFLALSGASGCDPSNLSSDYGVSITNTGTHRSCYAAYVIHGPTTINIP